MTPLGYLEVRPVLAKIADLDRRLVLVGGQAVNFWATVYEAQVPALAEHGPFASKDIDFCGDRSSVRLCAERLGGTARVAGLDDVTPNSGTVVFVDAAGVTRTLDIVSAPFGLSAAEVRETAVPIDIVDDNDKPSGCRFYVIHPVLSMESRVHNVVGLAATYDTPQGRNQLRASIVCAHEFMRDVLEGRIDAEDPTRTVLKLNERIFRFCARDSDAKWLSRATGIEPARALLDHPSLPRAFRERRLPQMRDVLSRLTLRGDAHELRTTPSDEPPRAPRDPERGRDNGPER